MNIQGTKLLLNRTDLFTGECQQRDMGDSRCFDALFEKVKYEKENLVAYIFEAFFLFFWVPNGFIDIWVINMKIVFIVEIPVCLAP